MFCLDSFFNNIFRKFSAENKNRLQDSSDWLFGYLTRASTVSEETVGDGAMTTSGSPNNTSSQRICRWIRTDWKHLSRGQRSHETNRKESI